MASDHGSSIKDDATYEALRDQGASKPKAARIANAQASDERDPAKKGGEAPAYERWTMNELMERATELDVTGRWKLNKDELIDALRNC
jgi:hypothetical protein